VTVLYKVLDQAGASQYQHTSWPLPLHGMPGDWFECHDKGPLVMCANGLHGWESLDKALQEARSVWGAQVYEMEVDDSEEVLRDRGGYEEKMCCRRARLVRLVGDSNGELILMSDFVWQ
jgi:hypothetical protein